MSEIADQVQPVTEHASESRMNSYVALLVALTATCMALCNVKDGNVVQAMQQAQSQAVDQWSYYQAKGTKQHMAENTADLLRLQAETVPGLKPDGKALLEQKALQYEAQAKKYEKEKEAIKAEAQRLEKLYDELNHHDDQFDMADASLTVAIALASVASLTRKRWLFAMACSFSAFGVLLGVAGFLKWNFHPDWLAKLLG